MRRLVASFTALCVALAPMRGAAGPHEEGVAAGRAANPVARATITADRAGAVVPGYSTTPAETAHYRQPNLAARGQAQLDECAGKPKDPLCQAQRGAMRSAVTPRPALGHGDAAVAAAAAINRSPSLALEDIASFYSGCTVSTTSVAAGTQARSCLRPAADSGAGSLSCTRSLSVDVERNTSCPPGEWFAQAASGNVAVGAQCLPDRPATAQHFRVTQDGTPLAFFDVDMTVPTTLPLMVAGTSSFDSWGQPRAVWVTDQACDGDACSVTALLAAQRVEICTGGGDTDISCRTIEAFLLRYGACPAGTQSGDLIQESSCNGDLGCTTTALDGKQCYAPSASATPLAGIDITGSVAGYYWQVHGDRAVVGWEPNPEYGAIPTLRLAYTRPATTITTSDRWDESCPLATGDRCSEPTPPVCSEGPSTKLIDGVSVTRDCWRYERTSSCAGSTSPSDCAALVATGCTPGPSSCRRSNAATGACELWEDSYTCPVAAQVTRSASNCPSNVFCLQGNCFDIGHPGDGDFARSMAMLEATREAGVYLDTDQLRVFRGEDNRCRDRLLKNCCTSDGSGAGMTNQSVFGAGSRLVYDVLMNATNREFIYQGISALLTGAGFSGSFTTYGVTVAVNGTALPAGSVAVFSGESIVVAFDPWSLAIAVILYVVMSAASCDEEEGRLSMKEGARLCHSVGTYCSSCIRVLGSCVSCITHTTRKCCFNSMLARIVNEQGRHQVGKGWGTAKEPDCSGFTVAQLQSLDFAAMDLSEFYASLVPKLPNVGALQSQSGARVPACYYGQGRCQ